MNYKILFCFAGTLYGRCKREGIELSRSNPTPWSEDAMMEALEAVRVGQMSINQAAIHYNLPYSSLYGRFKRGKYDTSSDGGGQMDHSPENTVSCFFFVRKISFRGFSGWVRVISLWIWVCEMKRAKESWVD